MAFAENTIKEKQNFFVNITNQNKKKMRKFQKNMLFDNIVFVLSSPGRKIQKSIINTNKLEIIT